MTACKSIIAGIALVAIGGGDFARAEGGDAVLARLGETSITLADVDASLAFIPERHRAGYMNDPERVGQHVEAVLLRRALFEDEQVQALMAEVDVEALRSSVEQDLLAEAYLRQRTQSVDQMLVEQRAYAIYEENPERFTVEQQATVRHILVGTDLRDEEAALEIIREIQSRLAAGEVFDELVMEYSDDPGTIRSGGRLVVTRGRMVPEFEQAAFALTEPGQVSEPVQTQYGIHLIQLLSREEGGVRPYSEVAPRLREEAIQALIDEERQRITEEMDSPLEELVTLARAEGLDRAPGFERRVQLELEKRYTDVYRTVYLDHKIPQDLGPVAREYFVSRPDEFHQPETIKIQQIELAESIHGEGQAKALAEEVVAKARAGEDFTLLVRQYSDSRSKLRDRGIIERHTLYGLYEELREQIFALDKGQISDPIRTRKGYLVVRVLDKWPAYDPTFEEVKDQIVETIRAAREKDLWHEHLESFKRREFWADPELVASLRVRYLPESGTSSESP